jgi:hypothetical protein
MTKVKAEGYRINGFFCEANQPVPCSLIKGLDEFEKEYNDYCYGNIKKVPTPSIEKTGTFYRFKHTALDTLEYLDEETGLIYEFYKNPDMPGNPLMIVVREEDLKKFFMNYFEFNYWESDNIPSKRFIKNLLKWTEHKTINDFVERFNAEGTKIRNDPNYQGNPDWDGTLGKEYAEELVSEAGLVEG